LRSSYGVRIGFISWLRILDLFTRLKGKLDKPYSILLDEFLIFARHHRLGTLTDMNADEIRAFLTAYPTVYRYQDAAIAKFSKVLSDVTQRVIRDCGGRAREFNNYQLKLPCIHRSLDVTGWHTSAPSLFIFLNIVTKQIGLVANGYESSEQRQDFLPLWNAQFKQTFRDNPKLHAFTWVVEDGDGDGADYFRLVTDASGGLSDPVGDLETYFYWGYCYPLEIDKLEEGLFAQIGSDASELLASFTPTKFRRV
jgi:hypothetical protein